MQRSSGGVTAVWDSETELLTFKFPFKGFTSAGSHRKWLPQQHRDKRLKVDVGEAAAAPAAAPAAAAPAAAPAEVIINYSINYLHINHKLSN